MRERERGRERGRVREKERGREKKRGRRRMNRGRKKERRMRKGGIRECKETIGGKVEGRGGGERIKRGEEGREIEKKGKKD